MKLRCRRDLWWRLLCLQRGTEKEERGGRERIKRGKLSGFLVVSVEEDE